MGGSGPVNWLPMEIGLAAGFISRLISLRPGQRGYPGYPSGYISELTMGIIAAMIGSAVITSLVAKEFTAATFLTLAATQFRNVREAERKTLEQEEDLILVPRGAGYIEGIARTFEARNYLAMLVGLGTSGATALFGWVGGVVAGIVLLVLGERFMSGGVVGDVIDVQPGQIRFEKESLLYVDDVMLMEVGLPHVRDRWLKDGMGVVLTPKNPRGQAVLWNLAQRQAITHEAAMAVGAMKDVGYPDFTPLTRMEMPQGTGRAALAIVPVMPDMNALLNAIRQTPILESSKWHHLMSPVLAEKAKRSPVRVRPGREPSPT
ncbi:MAG: YIEGIA family protein [Actinomycetia bacterium]|nr:YIEGIA family protein [Actinomycetes bacterium]